MWPQRTKAELPLLESSELWSIKQTVMTANNHANSDNLSLVLNVHCRCKHCCILHVCRQHHASYKHCTGAASFSLQDRSPLSLVCQLQLVTMLFSLKIATLDDMMNHGAKVGTKVDALRSESPQLQHGLQWPKGRCLQEDASLTSSLLGSSHPLLECPLTA